MENDQVQEILKEFTAICIEELGENLLGIYLHGSLAMGCFHPARSDIDLLVVVRDKLTRSCSSRIASKLLYLRDAIVYGLEVSVMPEAALHPVAYPTPCELHFSDYHRERYRTVEGYVCGDYEDEDLASQIAVAYHRGSAVYGEPLAAYCPPVLPEVYLASILHDIEGAAAEIAENPLYITLNLCRVLFYIKEGRISSKKEGGEWGAAHVPLEFRGLVQMYLNEYTGVLQQDMDISPNQLAAFAGYMLGEIYKEVKGRTYK